MYLMGGIELCIGISRGQRDDVRKEQGESEHGVSVEWVQGPALRGPYEWVWTLICRQRRAKESLEPWVPSLAALQMLWRTSQRLGLKWGGLWGAVVIDQ